MPSLASRNVIPNSDTAPGIFVLLIGKGNTSFTLLLLFLPPQRERGREGGGRGVEREKERENRNDSQ